MEADTGLTYSSTDWQETLKSFDPIKDNRSKMALEPYPDEKVLVAFAKLAYFDCMGELVLPEGWQLLTTAQNTSRTNGYFGCALWNPSQQQVVIAHRGTKPNCLGATWTNFRGIYYNKYTDYLSSAVSFADDIKKAILETNKHHDSRLILSISGHSLGAWLAGVTTMTVKHLKRDDSGFCRIVSPEEGLHAHTLALDSPGVKDILNKICSDYDLRYGPSMFTNQLDITTIFVAVNLVNSFGLHVGDIYQVHIKRVRGWKSEWLQNFETHGIDAFIKALHEGREKYVVQNWPRGSRECEQFHKLERCGNSHILLPDAEQVPLASSSGRKDPILQYRSELSLGNTCQLGVFSVEEIKFLENWSLFQNNTIIKRTEIKKFESYHNLEKLDLPIFKIDTRRNTIACETREDLERLIRQTKQLLRWFPTEIMKAVDKQNRSIKTTPLYVAGQAYLRTLPDILDCEDTLGLESFLKSSEQRVLQIETKDLKFGAARLYNILIRINNISLDGIYLNEGCHTFLGWNDLLGMATYVDIEGLNKSDVTYGNLLIIEFASPFGEFLSNYDILGRILKNLETCVDKKLVIILPRPIDSQFYVNYNLTVETKPSKVFELSDLTPTSREEILARDAIALGRKSLSLNTLLGIGFKSLDEHV